MSDPKLTINGVQESVADAPVHRTLLEHLRLSGRTGTKEGCGEGDCGACTVALLDKGPDGRPAWTSANSCLLPLAALHGREVVTVEGLAQGSELHPVQRALVEHGGSQCGYCTPGFVMSLFTGYYDGDLSEGAIEGNLCRCTGYLPIRRAAEALGGERREDLFAERLARPVARVEGSSHARDGARFERPASLAEALALLQEEGATPIAGGTDLGVEIGKFGRRPPFLVSLEAVPELRVWEDDGAALTIGAGVPLSVLEHRAAGRLPALDEMLRLFAARQVRNRATLGGNLGTASPIGDLPPVLLALDADLLLVGPDGDRVVPVGEFFLGYRETALAPGELVRAVRVPLGPGPDVAERRSFSYKVGKRGTDDISIVAAAFALDLDRGGAVVRARLAFGGVAATPVRAREVEAWLEGRRWDEAAARGAAARLREAFTPLDDHRGSARYRRALCGNLLEKFFHDTRPAEVAA